MHLQHRNMHHYNIPTREEEPCASQIHMADSGFQHCLEVKFAGRLGKKRTRNLFFAHWSRKDRGSLSNIQWLVEFSNEHPSECTVATQIVIQMSCQKIQSAELTNYSRIWKPAKSLEDILKDWQGISKGKERQKYLMFQHPRGVHIIFYVISKT